MGESWSDLDALEYQARVRLLRRREPVRHRRVRDRQPDRRASATTRSTTTRSTTATSASTSPGPEVHADGEIWNGDELRPSARRSSTSTTRRTRTATSRGRRRARTASTPRDACPGNRRWIQIVYDAWLLEPATSSMLDARDAYLAADVMRFGGANQTELWRAFAQRGMGSGAVEQHERGRATRRRASSRPPRRTRPSRSARSRRTRATRRCRRRSTSASTRTAPCRSPTRIRRTSLGNTAKFVPGTYDFVVQAPGYGLSRFTQTFTATATAVTFKLQTNWASSASGASATGDGGAAELASLIDDTENTNWSVIGQMPSVAGTQATVALGGGAHKISSVRVSAMLEPGSRASRRSGSSGSTRATRRRRTARSPRTSRASTRAPTTRSRARRRARSRRT